MFEWNTVPGKIPILPVVHGTSADIAWDIAGGGFANLSTLDDGFYEKGIYFSSSAKYITPYYANKKNPAILICLSCPGNLFPIATDPKALSRPYLGKPITSGYQSHYVITNLSGNPAQFKLETSTMFQNIWDELVISLESQVLPVFLLEINTKSVNFQNLVQDYQRVVQKYKPKFSSKKTKLKTSIFSNTKIESFKLDLPINEEEELTDRNMVSLLSEDDPGNTIKDCYLILDDQ